MTIPIIIWLDQSCRMNVVNGLKKHYAKRIPSITVAFGLYNDHTLQGVCFWNASKPNFM